MPVENLVALLEALLLTSSGPITVENLIDALGDDAPAATSITAALESLQEQFRHPNHGVRLERVAGGWRFTTLPEFDETLRTFHGITARQRLSQAALEVLSIIAHRQPVTLPEINFLRGANSTGVVRTLLDRRLIRLAGRKKVVGKPFLYRTTREFLIHFGLDRIEELPEPEKLLGEDASGDL